MPWPLKCNALAVLALGALFCCYFQFAKHDPVLSAIIPFANDPYDAVGSFAAIISVLLGGLAFLRAFRPYPKSAATATQRLFLARTLMAIVLAALITLVTDAVAMGRHPAWMGHRGALSLVVLTAGLAILAAAAGYLTQRLFRDGARPSSRQWAEATITLLVLVAALACFPESAIRSTGGEIAALASGIVLLFLPMSAWVVALVPSAMPDGTASPVKTLPSWLPWTGIVLLGIAIGSFFLLLEAREAGGIPSTRLMTVAAVFVGAGTTGLLTAYAFLKKPLGL